MVYDAKEFIRKKFGRISPKTAIILGSGLGIFSDTLENKKSIKYKDIPGFKKSTVKGHSGELVYGKKSNKELLIMNGRYHFYEGHKMTDIIFPIRILKSLGIENLIITNAAGGVNKNFSPGNLMLIKDHINFCGTNPLIGPNDDDLGPRFPDMSNAYNMELRDIALNAANNSNIELKEGVYAMMTGPSYETPSEIKMLSIIGADAVGMSTVPEVITAVHCGIRVMGISCITNMAAGILDSPLNHSEVIETANKEKYVFVNLLDKIIQKVN